MTQPTASFDARPLTAPVDRAAVRAFNRALRTSGAGAGLGSVVAIIVAVFGIVFVGSILTTTAAVFVSFVSSSGAPGPILILFAVFGVLVFGGVIAIIVFVVVRIARGGFAGDRRYRLDSFARANGMAYVPRLDKPQLPGMIFGLGSSRHSLDLVRGTQPRFVEFANYRYTTSSGKNSTTHTWGYVAVKLDVPLPHIVLDARSNNGLFGSNLPLAFGKDQRLSLEGDFDEYFSLYAPEGYERDALYLFTPDIMARFIDNAAALDVEIVDDWLFLYAKRDFSTIDPRMWAWLFSVVGALLDKLAQWARWRDERLESDPAATEAPLLRPPPGVAAPGQRLRRGIPWAAVVIGAIVLLLWMLPQLSGFVFGLFGSP